MKSSSLQEVKKELKELSPVELLSLCVALAKYKKDNKEYLAYLLFQAHDPISFTGGVKAEIDAHFLEMSKQKNLYYIKKSLRKLLRVVNKYCKYLGEKTASIDLLIYICLKIKQAKIPIHKSARLENLYLAQLKKISTLISSLHPEVQTDYLSELEGLQYMKNE